MRHIMYACARQSMKKTWSSIYVWLSKSLQAPPFSIIIPHILHTNKEGGYTPQSAHTASHRTSPLLTVPPSCPCTSSAAITGGTREEGSPSEPRPSGLPRFLLPADGIMTTQHWHGDFFAGRSRGTASEYRGCSNSRLRGHRSAPSSGSRGGDREGVCARVFMLNQAWCGGFPELHSITRVKGAEAVTEHSSSVHVYMPSHARLYVGVFRRRRCF